MRLQRPVGVLLALAILLGTLPASLLLAETPEADEAPRTLEESFRFDYGRLALVPGTPRQRDAQYTVSLNRDIDAQKAMLTELLLRRQLTLALFDNPDEDCERQEIERHYQAETQALRDQIVAIRDLRGGERRRFFTRLGDRIGRDIRTAWHRVGPLGRKIMRELGNEAVIVVTSGGTLHGGAARRLLLAVGRRHAPELLLRAVTRRARQADAQAIAGAKAACGVAELAADGPPPASTMGAWELGLCTGSAQFSLEGFMPAPPYSQPYTLVRFDWPHREAVMLTYFATSGDPHVKYPAYDAVMTAGCPDDLDWNNCAPAIPLVFTQAEEAAEGSANNRHHKPGQFTLAVEPKGACIYTNDNGDWDTSYPYPADIEVTATIEHYKAGETTPYAVEGPLQATVPFWSDDPFKLPLPAGNRRVLGTFEFNPELSASPAPSVGVGSDELAPWEVEGE
jgi:hypothetical protein